MKQINHAAGSVVGSSLEGVTTNAAVSAALRVLVTITFLLLPAFAMAEEAAEAGHEGPISVPFTVALQAINFVIFFGFLIWFIRHPVKTYFKNREEHFNQALVKAEHAKREAEERKREIMSRIDQLQETSATALATAQSEAAALKQSILKEANEMSARLKDDAHRTAEFEIERAKISLRDELLRQSIQLAQKVLADKIADGDQKRLQTEFVDKIQVVR